MVVQDTKTSQKMKIQKFVKYRKKYYRMRKQCLIITIRSYYLKRKNDLESSFDEVKRMF